MKTQGKKCTAHQIANLGRGSHPAGGDLVQVSASTPAPLAFPASAARRLDPPGGRRAVFCIPLCVTPFRDFEGRRVWG